MDEKLALGRWDLVQQEKASLPSEKLARGAQRARLLCAWQVLLSYCLAQSFLVTMEYNPHNPGSPTVNGVGTRARETFRREIFPEGEQLYMSETGLEDILHGIWPSGPGAEGW